MSKRRVRVPGDRDVRAVLETPDAAACVVACPPHPGHGGSRSDPRLRAVAAALGARDIACLRFDYGPWDRGYGERTDASNAVRWAADRFDRVALFGYSFGGAVALLVAPDAPVAAVSALAPTARIGGEPADDPDSPARESVSLDAGAAVADIDVPVQVVYGERDDTADWRPVVEAARARGAAVERLPADHFFVGRYDRVGELVAEFVAPALA